LLRAFVGALKFDVEADGSRVREIVLLCFFLWGSRRELASSESDETSREKREQEESGHGRGLS
jgi:hypothetical protein